MQMCPWCDKVYDETEYSRCPYCSGELKISRNGTKIKDCPECGCIMYWDGCWECSNCDHTINTGEDDNDGILVD